MRCPLGAAGSGHSPAWRRMLLTGSLLAFFTCSASSELPSSASLDPLTEGADAHLPVPRSLDGVLSTSWFRGHEAQPEAMIFSPEGLPGPGHTGRETLDTQGSLVIRNVTTQDAGSYTVVLETSRGRRSATEQIQVNANSDGVLLLTFPGNTQGILQSELNYSVILQWVASIEPEPVLRWTFNGHPRGIGERLIIHRLSLEDLGTYVCLAENSQGMYFSQPVTIMLPQDVVDPTDPVPIKPNPTLSLSGSSAFALIVAAPVVLVGSTVFTIIWKLRNMEFTVLCLALQMGSRCFSIHVKKGTIP
ncbi:immunoglobulin superfamily member 23 [Eubalaena glacialis]|uniref:immunoglobulin superfamily member 23 n=1 Tax=Eubalaena glacialis TaxID=27606 RepID=UPI002A5A55C8|nr:immunoglobulin superfamily member 23 [Eubalaena glacialis]